MEYTLTVTNIDGITHSYTICTSSFGEPKNLNDFILEALQISKDKRELPFTIQSNDGESYPKIKMKFENYGSPLLGDKIEAMKKIMFNDKYGLTEAVLSGKKTQTRRIVPLTQVDRTYLDTAFDWDLRESIVINWYEHYKVGEIIAVAQSYKTIGIFEEKSSAGYTNKMFVKASLMPHQIQITGVRIERLRNISEEDAEKEGVNGVMYDTNGREAFAYLINKISGKGIWQRNPYVFVYDFKLIK